MLQPLFFWLALANNIMLIIIFSIRKKVDLRTLGRVGAIYLLLALPAAFGLYLAVREPGAARHAIFLGIFLAFLALEGIYDFVLKVPFRENWDWRLLTPYLALYYAIQGEDRRSEQIRQMVKRVDEAKDTIPARSHQEPALA